MTADFTPTTLRARYLFPIAGPPIENGTIVIQDGSIVAVGDSNDSGADDLGNVAIVPGLVNAHTHLEFSDLEAPLGTGRHADYRMDSGANRLSSAVAAEALLEAIKGGVRECLATGTTTLGEIATSDWRRPLADRLPPVTIRMFRELIAPRSERVNDGARTGPAVRHRAGSSADFQRARARMPPTRSIPACWRG